MYTRIGAPQGEEPNPEGKAQAFRLRDPLCAFNHNRGGALRVLGSREEA